MVVRRDDGHSHAEIGAIEMALATSRRSKASEMEAHEQQPFEDLYEEVIHGSV